MISSLIFINSNFRVTPPEKYIDVFEGSTVNIQDQIYDMESSVDCSNESNSDNLKKLNNTYITYYILFLF